VARVLGDDAAVPSLTALRRAARVVVPRSARAWTHARRVAVDWDSARRYVQLDTGTVAENLVELRVRALDGASIFLRPGTSDLEVLRYTVLEAYHLPPPELERDITLIWDLGANIGTTMAHLAHRYPDARVVGVEIDSTNADLARRNLAPWAERCEVLEGAVWPHSGQVEYLRETGMEWGAHVNEGGGLFTQAITLDDLAGEPDYVKMNIEGAEARVLRENTSWASRVRAIKIEVHNDGYSVSECFDDLKSLGFTPRRDPQYADYVIGIRER
jgi:FkbM family methyltransferase